MTERVEVIEATWRPDADGTRLRRLSMLLLAVPSSEALTDNLTDRSPLDVSGPGVQASDARRSVREGFGGGA